MILWQHVRATGRVQGVFYRDSTKREARRLGLTGWVRNMADGSVEARLEGTKEQIEEMIAWMHEGPPLALVDRVETLWQGEGADFTSFDVRH